MWSQYLVLTYSPINNFSFLSKLTEKASAAQVVCHSNSHNLFPRKKSAYRKKKKITVGRLRPKDKNGIFLNMNKQYFNLLVHFDLSSAFDTLDNSILIDRLTPILASLRRLYPGLNLTSAFVTSRFDYWKTTLRSSAYSSCSSPTSTEQCSQVLLQYIQVLTNNSSSLPTPLGSS